MGRPLICTCGTVELWHGTVQSPGNSQHLSDWYSLSHVIHGFLFFGALWMAGGKWPALRPWALPIAVLVEAAWEVVENTPMVIDRYRAVTIAWGYSGDSIINSMSDIAMMALGFWIAARLPWWATVGLGLALELIALIAIRDNLTLNVLMLLFPIEGVADWQAAA